MRNFYSHDRGSFTFPRNLRSVANVPDPMPGIEAALAENAQIPYRPPLFSRGGTGRVIVGLLGDYLAQLGGGNPVYRPLIVQRRD